MLTYPQWKLNRQIAYGFIGVVAVAMVVVAVVAWWKQSEAEKRAAKV